MPITVHILYTRNCHTFLLGFSCIGASHFVMSHWLCWHRVCGRCWPRWHCVSAVVDSADIVSAYGCWLCWHTANFFTLEKIKKLMIKLKSKKNFFFRFSKIVCTRSRWLRGYPVGIVVDYAIMCWNSCWLCGHENDYAYTFRKVLKASHRFYRNSQAKKVTCVSLHT